MTQAGVARVIVRRPTLGNPLRREIVSFHHLLALTKPQMSGAAKHLSKYYGTQEVHTGVTRLSNRMIEGVLARPSTSPSTMIMISQMSANITS